ncbi:MAG: lytic transglycosylase domain-containing protein [Thiobacillus sp.]|nr:lytic transglycosylase domain-containing protein [Thiobacillus sp.]
MKKTLHLGLVAAALLLAQPVWAGAQREEALSASARASLQKSLADTAVTRTAFRNPADEAAWLKEMSRRLAKRMPDAAERLEFLTTLHWEASRAGVDPQLMLGLIQVESGFRKYAVSPVGARGYTQVMPFWVKAIGNPDHNLFQLRTNLRYGALILRHYIDIERGDLYRALGRYNGSLGQPEYPTLVVGAWKRHWDYTPPARTAEAARRLDLASRN